MQSPLKILLSASLGAATMYYLDPTRGRYRRARAQARIEHGREAVTHGVHQATHGLDKAAHRARVARRSIGRRADKAVHGARAFGHDFGDRADQFSHGARSFGHEARERTAGAAATLGSFFERHRPRDIDYWYGSGESRPARVLKSPATWLATVTVGAVAMYFFDPSHGFYRRAKVRYRLTKWRQSRRLAKMDDRAKSDDPLKERQASEQPHPGNGTDRRSHDRDTPIPG